jgi:hypothetical protein
LIGSLEIDNLINISLSIIVIYELIYFKIYRKSEL